LAGHSSPDKPEENRQEIKPEEPLRRRPKPKKEEELSA
jgi:hypothetical protein